MSRVKILLWQDEPSNPDGYPPLWPSQVFALAEEDPAPEVPWLEMTDAEYDAYREAHQPDMDAWQADWNAAHPPVIPGDNI